VQSGALALCREASFPYLHVSFNTAVRDNQAPLWVTAAALPSRVAGLSFPYLPAFPHQQPKQAA